MASIPWDVRRSAHLEELRMEVQALRTEWDRHVAASELRLALMESAIAQAVDIATAPPPLPTAPAKVIPISRVA